MNRVLYIGQHLCEVAEWFKDNPQLDLSDLIGHCVNNEIFLLG